MDDTRHSHPNSRIKVSGRRIECREAGLVKMVKAIADHAFPEEVLLIPLPCRAASAIFFKRVCFAATKSGFPGRVHTKKSEQLGQSIKNVGLQVLVTDNLAARRVGLPVFEHLFHSARPHRCGFGYEITKFWPLFPSGALVENLVQVPVGRYDIATVAYHVYELCVGQVIRDKKEIIEHVVVLHADGQTLQLLVRQAAHPPTHSSLLLYWSKSSPSWLPGMTPSGA